MELNEKLKLIRKIEKYTQRQLAELLNIDETNYQRYEYGNVSPNAKIIQKLCSKFPEYTLWIMTGETNKADQISPHDKVAKSDKTA